MLSIYNEIYKGEIFLLIIYILYVTIKKNAIMYTYTEG